ncbi:MAG: efflux RND transporter permease subunit [Gammaproteobacteria bacterium]|nr:efflux RND transporter permease subunit [Gammaproteobacteria bacterium]
MIARLIRASIEQRAIVLTLSLFLAAWGIWAVRSTPIDALPDLSDVQVIIRTSLPGQAPQIVENQVTYPLTTTMLSVPGAKSVRGYSFYGDSFVYVLFEDGTDLYWARSRVLEYLNQVQSRLPPTAKSNLGPDATGVGWIYQYALVDRSGRHDLGQLRALQDWFLKFELSGLPEVAEVATIGGMVQQYQVLLDPMKLASYGMPIARVIAAIQAANRETGGGVIEIAEAEYMVRASTYLRGIADLRAVPLGTASNGIPIVLADVAIIQRGPEMRRGIAELDGEGETVGAVVLLRAGGNARATIAAVRKKLAELTSGLPEGVEIVPVYDRSELIDRAVANLTNKLIEEFAVVMAVTVIFLFHLRSALVAIILLPLSVLAAFIVMKYQGITANIMSLGGIAIAVGAMVDAVIVMLENAHKHLEHWQHAHPANTLDSATRWRVIGDAASEVGPAIFISLLLITISFTPIFALVAQEGRLFGPLAYTKTYAMAAAACLSVTLAPVLMGYVIRGRIPREADNPLSVLLVALYLPLLNAVLRWPRTTLLLAGLALLSAIYPWRHLGSEFMPALDEGDLLYMPTALPGLSAAKASELLQRTDRMIKAMPEVEHVFGKAGRAETATDPAPLEMFETTIKLKPREAWRPGLTLDALIAELDRRVQVPGLSNLWVPPIRNRIDMLATGIKSPIGVKISGPDPVTIERTARAIEKIAKVTPGVSSALAERLTGGRYLDIEIDRQQIAQYGLTVAEIQTIIAAAVGGENIDQTVEGLARFPINVRYPRELRDSLTRLRELPFVASNGQLLTLGAVATVKINDGPPQIRSENARLSGWVYVDVNSSDLGRVVRDLRTGIAAQVPLPVGVTVTYSGQYEYLARATARLQWVAPAVIAIIFVLLLVVFARVSEALVIMLTIPCASVGGLWLLYSLDYQRSVATGVGFIALTGVAAEFGIVMLWYLRQALERQVASGITIDIEQLKAAIREGAVSRVRPKAMTAAVILAGLLPILLGTGTGSEIMRRIAAPMVGGMVTAPLLSLFVIPAAFFLLQRKKLRRV